MWITKTICQQIFILSTSLLTTTTTATTANTITTISTDIKIVLTPLINFTPLGNSGCAANIGIIIEDFKESQHITENVAESNSGLIPRARHIVSHSIQRHIPWGGDWVHV